MMVSNASWNMARMSANPSKTAKTGIMCYPQRVDETCCAPRRTHIPSYADRAADRAGAAPDLTLCFTGRWALRCQEPERFARARGREEDPSGLQRRQGRLRGGRAEPAVRVGDGGPRFMPPRALRVSLIRGTLPRALGR